MSGGWYIQGLGLAAFYAIAAVWLYNYGHHFASGMFLGLAICTLGVMVRELRVHGGRK